MLLLLLMQLQKLLSQPFEIPFSISALDFLPHLLSLIPSFQIVSQSIAIPKNKKCNDNLPATFPFNPLFTPYNVIQAQGQLFQHKQLFVFHPLPHHIPHNLVSKNLLKIYVSTLLQDFNSILTDPISLEAAGKNSSQPAA